MNKITLGVVAFAMMALLGVGLISAQGGLGFRNMDEDQKAEFQEQREAMQNAVESGDYELWKILMNNRIEEMKEKLTEEEFEAIQTMHQERAENGEGFGKGVREGMGKKRVLGEHRIDKECQFADAE